MRSIFSHTRLGIGVASAFVILVSAAAASAITVSGVVGHQQTNTYMSGVTCTLSSPGFNRTATTDVNGQYLFTSITPGSYSLSCSKSGYQFYPPLVSGDMIRDQVRDFTGSGPTPDPLPSPTPGSPTVAWSAYYDGPLGFSEVNPVLAVDSQGNSYVASMSFNQQSRYGDTDIAVVKRSEEHTPELQSH